MHFYCECGKRISDTTDELPYKARIIADQDWFSFLDAVCEVMEKETDREKMINAFYNEVMKAAGRHAYQCTDGGRICLDNHEHQLCAFVPEGVANKRILNSYMAGNWKGRLYAFGMMRSRTGASIME